MSKTRHFHTNNCSLGSILRKLTNNPNSIAMVMMSDASDNFKNECSENSDPNSVIGYSTTKSCPTILSEAEADLNTTADLGEEEEVSTKIDLDSLSVICQLDEGAQGQVFLVKCKHTQMKYALKVSEKSGRFKNNGNFLREANILKDLDHPFIVKMIDSYETEKHVSLLMEF